MPSKFRRITLSLFVPALLLAVIACPGVIVDNIIIHFPKGTITGSTGTFLCISPTPVDVVAFQWNFGDGKTAEGRRVSHSYDSTGTFIVTCTVITSTTQMTFTKTIVIGAALVNASTLTTISTSVSGNGVVTDSQGNSYIIGELEGTVDIDPGPGVTNLTPIGIEDTLVASYDATGALRWGFNLGDAGQGNIGLDIDIDSSGNIYIIGDLRGTVDFDPSGGTANVAENGFGDVFVASYTSSGLFRWAHAFGDTVTDSSGGITVDSQNNVYITMDFGNTVDFDPGGGTANVVANGTSTALASYTSGGAFRWVVPFVGTASNFAGDVAVGDSDHIFVNGEFQGTVDFDPSGSTLNLTATGVDLYFASYTSSGALRWAFLVDATIDVRAGVLETDPFGNLIASGNVNGTADFDPGGGTLILDEALGGSSYMASYTQASGALNWAFNVDFGFRDLAIDDAGNILATGTGEVTEDFDPGPGVFQLTAPPPGDDFAYVARYTNSGDFDFAFGLFALDDSKGRGISVGAGGIVYVLGRYDSDIDLDPGPGEFILPGNGFDQLFIAQYVF